MDFNIHLFRPLRKERYWEILAFGFSPYGIIIVGHFCKRVVIYVYFLEQDIIGETRTPENI